MCKCGEGVKKRFKLILTKPKISSVKQSVSEKREFKLIKYESLTIYAREILTLELNAVNNDSK